MLHEGGVHGNSGFEQYRASPDAILPCFELYEVAIFTMDYMNFLFQLKEKSSRFITITSTNQSFSHMKSSIGGGEVYKVYDSQ
jgi:hypothetical protein